MACSGKWTEYSILHQIRCKNAKGMISTELGS